MFWVHYWFWSWIYHIPMIRKPKRYTDHLFIFSFSTQPLTNPSYLTQQCCYPTFNKSLACSCMMFDCIYFNKLSQLLYIVMRIKHTCFIQERKLSSERSYEKPKTKLLEAEPGFESGHYGFREIILTNCTIVCDKSTTLNTKYGKSITFSPHLDLSHLLFPLSCTFISLAPYSHHPHAIRDPFFFW